MNCQDIGNILNDNDIGALSSSVVDRAREHLATCDECARDWKAHERMLAMPMPVPGPGLLGWRPANGAADTVVSSRRPLGGSLIFGALIGVGAAAAVFVAVEQSESIRTTAIPTAATTSDDASSQDEPVEAAADSSPVTTDALDLSAIRASRPGYPYAFTAVVAPSMTDPQYDAMAALIEVALLEKLRSIPHLILIEPASFDGFLNPEGLALRPPPAGINYLLQLQQPAPADAGRTVAGQWSIDVHTRISGGDEIETKTIRGGSDLPLSIEEAHSTIDGAFEVLSTHVFPPEDLSLLGEMRNTVLDPTRPKEERLAVFGTLAFFFPGRFNIFDDVVQLDVSRSVAVTVTEIVTNSPDREVRLEAWLAVRWLGDPYLIAPLVESLQREPAFEVRHLALRMLAENFSSDPVARTALDAAAQNDSEYMIRIAARWANANESDRRAQLSDMMAEYSGHPEWVSAIFQDLFPDAVDYVTPATAEILLDVVAAFPQDAHRGIIKILAEAPTGEVVPLLLERLRDNPDAATRRVAALALIGRQDEPGVVDALRYARDNDPSPEVRLAAFTVR